MKAKQQQAEAEKAAQAAASVPETTAASETPSKLQPVDTMVFHGGFFKVESPMKSAGRRTLHLKPFMVFFLSFDFLIDLTQS